MAGFGAQKQPRIGLFSRFPHPPRTEQLGERLALMEMDERYEETEEEHDAKQRDASLARVLAGLFILFLFGILVMAALALWQA